VQFQQGSHGRITLKFLWSLVRVLDVITVPHYNREQQGVTITVPLKKQLSTVATNSEQEIEYLGGKKQETVYLGGKKT